MNPEQITPELLEWLKQTAEKSAEFVEREAPLLATEIVAWHFWASAVWFCGFSVAFLVAATIAARAYRAWSLQPVMTPHYAVPADTITVTYGFVIGISTFLAAVLFMVTVGFAHDAIKAAVAPRVVILEYVKGAVK